MKLYENQFIGGFIYSLGLYAGIKRGEAAEVAISLMQQTPLDKNFNDLFLSLQGRSFIFEFKRDAKNLSDEYKKPIKLDLLKILSMNEEMTKLSHKSHFLCYPLHSGQEFRLVLSRYANLLSYNRKIYQLNSNVLDFIEDERNGLNQMELKEYIDFLSANSGTNQGISCVVINVNEMGNISFHQYENVLEKELIHEKEISKSKSPGLGLDF